MDTVFSVSQPNEADPAALLKTVLITGGGSGIGAALAHQLASRGCHVLISGRRRSALEAVAGSYERISTCVGDVTDPSHRTTLMTSLAGRPGPRAIVHAAGYFQSGLLEKLSTHDWRRSFETNVEARWALSCECAHLLDAGRILFIGSDAGANPRAGAAAYSIAQAASETLRRALRAEWANRPTAVGAFKPGLVDTEMVRGFMRLSPEEFPPDPHTRTTYPAATSHQLRPSLVSRHGSCWTSERNGSTRPTGTSATPTTTPNGRTGPSTRTRTRRSRKVRRRRSERHSGEARNPPIAGNRASPQCSRLCAHDR